MKEFTFKQAIPVWESGTETRKNYALVFQTEIQGINNTVLTLACSSTYQIYVNGNFAAAGPARSAHGFYKADRIDLTKSLTEDKNIIDILVVGYNTDSFSILNQPSFLCAELVCGNKIHAATGSHGFKAAPYIEKVQTVQRYSYQRTYLEYYKIAYSGFGVGAYNATDFCRLEPVERKTFIERDVYYPEYERFYYDTLISSGKAGPTNTLIRPYEDRALVRVGDIADGFKRNNLDLEATDYVGRIRFIPESTHKIHTQSADIASNSYAVFEGAYNNTGFITLDAECIQNTRLILIFDEILTDGFIDYTRNAAANIVVFDLPKGIHRLISVEPYTFKYVSVISIGGDIKIDNLGIIEYKFPTINTEFVTDNPNLNKIYTAAVETFRQSTLDIFMDCPSRERGGYLCDSFFTARTEYALTGKTVIEKSFLENYIAYDNSCNIPDGLLPMCYPSDFYKSEYIPNWAMWFVLELEEYLLRSRDTELVFSAKSKVYSIYNYFCRFENELGLLEKLDGWIFIEWSDSNKYVMDVNFPTNMLYYRMLTSIDRLYNDSNIRRKAEKLKQTILNLSYKDGFFHDRAVRDEKGVLTTTDEITETAQYYAFFMNVATEKEYPELWNILLNNFGAFRQEGIYANISQSNSFIGNYLRLDLLAKHSEHQRLEAEIDKLFFYMAEQTGTLWEDKSANRSSLCHGFASHAAVWLLSM